MNSNNRRVTLLFVGFLFALVMSHGAGAAIKCWTNQEGVRECGNAVPPEFAQKGHEKRSAAGVVLETKDRSKTKEELEAALVEAEKEAELKRVKAKRAALERVLLDTFSNVDDMELTRDGQIVASGGEIKLADSQISKLQKNLDKIIATAAEMERRGKTAPKNIQDDIASLQSQIARKDAFIAGKRKEQDEVRERFAEDIVRFEELHAKRLGVSAQ
jgi:hypothetical protein